jgi:4a-hydroxytetrahydrobiopterin dehydratase
MNLLANEYFKSSTAATKKLNQAEISSLLASLPDWHVNNIEGIDRLERSFSCRDFSTALAFANKVGALADAMNHHPAILTEWGKCRITWWTHSHGGLLRNDFIMAAKTDLLYAELGE